MSALSMRRAEVDIDQGQGGARADARAGVSPPPAQATVVFLYACYVAEAKF